MGARIETKAKTLAQDNASKITGLREAGINGEYADLYRTIVFGPSGQRSDYRVARIRYREFGPDEFTIVDIAGDCGSAGYAREVRHPARGRCWYVTAEDYDHRRISSGWFLRSGGAS